MVGQAFSLAAVPWPASRCSRDPIPRRRQPWLSGELLVASLFGVRVTAVDVLGYVVESHFVEDDAADPMRFRL